MAKTLKPHPLAELLPMMSEAEYESLRDSIRTGGQTDPIEIFEGKILDGRNRYRACTELNLVPKTRDFAGDHTAAVQLVYNRANHRHLDASQKAATAVGFLDHFEKLAAKRHGGHDKSPPAGEAAEQAGSLLGVSARYVYEARNLRDADPKLFRSVFDGQTTLSIAAREIRRREKAKAHQIAAKKLTAQPASVRADDCKIECRNVELFLHGLPDASARLIFADPPYNIGIDYGDGPKADRRSPEDFFRWCNNWIDEAHRVLTSDGSIFILCSSAMQHDIESMLRGHEEAEGFHRRNVIVWHETFGTYEAGNFSQCWRPILYYCKNPKKHVWHGDQILIESDRLKQGDSRANPAGKVPSNVWQFPRLVDNAAERMPGFPTQIPQALVERIVRVASDPGDLVVDPFVGSGTTAAAAVKNFRRFAGCDKQAANVKAALARAARVISERSK